MPWWTASYAVDISWLVINQLFLKWWILPFFTAQVSVALWINSRLIDYFGMGNFFKLSITTFTIFFAFTVFIIDDFGKFIVHLSFHKIPVLWPFHAVHHSATTLTPLTLYRIHPIEFIFNSIRSFTVGALISGLFVYLFANNVSVFTIAGVNIFIFMFNLAGSNLRHSSFYLGFGWAERLLISPAQHQIHHSVNVKHFNKNYGSALAIWDALFKSLMLSKKEQVSEVGLDQGKTDRQTIRQQWCGVRGK